VIPLSLSHAPFRQFAIYGHAKHDLTSEQEDRLIFALVILEAQQVARLDVQNLADVAIGLRPNELMTPRFLDPMR
jgi:hypothetical protein